MRHKAILCALLIFICIVNQLLQGGSRFKAVFKILVVLTCARQPKIMLYLSKQRVNLPWFDALMFWKHCFFDSYMKFGASVQAQHYLQLSV